MMNLSERHVKWPECNLFLIDWPILDVHRPPGVRPVGLLAKAVESTMFEDFN